ncbi:MAG TPA: TetR/AcrR family transcriptional regulator [Candidatus Deferrimicrobiaceae bacterium]|jgi:AcrR family transcriptional regulator|nr:TetR/AcrR family transcriptional regulator [Candidatus Deferrimicrobiaceae bacterium]
MATKQGMRVRVSDVTARERLLKSATELFTRKGYSGTTVREIVAAAEVTKPVLYYYFRNKEGIYLDLMRGGFSRFDSLLEESLSERGSAVERLTRLCTQVFSLFLDHIDVARVMYAIYYGPPQGAPFIDFDAYHRRLQDVVRGLVREGIRRGEFEKGNVDDMMWAILGALNVAMESQLCQPGDALDRNGLERVLLIIYKGIAATGGSRKPRGKGGGK